MQFQNKSMIAYLAALSIFFSYAEMLLPRIAPFFRLGLGNIIILLALGLDLPSFTVLTVIKAISSSMLSGTLFSPFFIISLVQSVVSGFVMFVIHLFGKRIFSLYGISLTGSASSAVIQILLSSLYLGKGTFYLLGFMLSFSIFSGLLTAFLAQKIKLPKEAPKLYQTQAQSDNALLLVPLLFCIVFTFIFKNPIILSCALVFSFIMQKFCSRKIYLLPHFSLWIFVFASEIFNSYGKIIFQTAGFSITQEAIIRAFEKACRLSIAASLSQCAATFQIQMRGIAGMAMQYFSGLCNCFRQTDGNLMKKIITSLHATELQSLASTKKGYSLLTAIIFSFFFIVFFIADILLKIFNS